MNTRKTTPTTAIHVRVDADLLARIDRVTELEAQRLQINLDRSDVVRRALLREVATLADCPMPLALSDSPTITA